MNLPAVLALSTGAIIAICVVAGLVLLIFIVIIRLVVIVRRFVKATQKLASCAEAL